MSRQAARTSIGCDAYGRQCGGHKLALLSRVAPRGFTLIELLVVVAIIALLLAILLPSLGSARLRAKHTLCAANLRSLGQAQTLYCDEYSGEFPRYFVDYTAPVAGRLWWFGFEVGGPGSTRNRPLDKTQSPLAPYTANLDNRIQCPLFPYEDVAYFPKFVSHAATYGYNMNLGPFNPSVKCLRSRYNDRLSRVFAFADGIQFESTKTFNEGFYIQYDANVGNPTKGLDGYAHFRHQGQAQLVYLDGHVESQLPSGPIFRTVGAAPSGNLIGLDGTNSIYGDPLP